MKTTKEERIGVGSFIHNTFGAKRACWDEDYKD
jgi:hypothetical protein